MFSTVEAILRTVERKHGKARRVWIFDRGCGGVKRTWWPSASAGPVSGWAPARSKLKQFEQELLKDDFEKIRPEVEVKQIQIPGGEETYILCRTAGRKEKEKAIRSRFVAKIEKALAGLKSASWKASSKDRDKMLLRLGRIQASHPQVADLYEMAVKDSKEGPRFSVYFFLSTRYKRLACQKTSNTRLSPSLLATVILTVLIAQLCLISSSSLVPLSHSSRASRARFKRINHRRYPSRRTSQRRCWSILFLVIVYIGYKLVKRRPLEPDSCSGAFHRHPDKIALTILFFLLKVKSFRTLCPRHTSARRKYYVPPLAPCPPACSGWVWCGLVCWLFLLGMARSLAFQSALGRRRLESEALQALQALQSGSTVRGCYLRCYVQMSRLLQRSKSWNLKQTMTAPRI